MTDCDVLIVGGGPAGSSCARGLRASGLDVVVTDRKTFPRDKPCAGWITPPVVDLLQIDLTEYARGRTLEPITGFATGMVGGKEVEINYRAPISYAIRRSEFDDYLLRRCGARLELGQGVRTLERAGDRWLINGDLRAKVLVGAGGHYCPVARHLGARPGREKAVAAQEIEFALTPEQQRTCPIPPGLPYLYFCQDLQGYGWYYRKGHYLNVGLGREDPNGLSEHVQSFRKGLQQRGRIPQDIPERFPGHAYLLYQHAPRDLVQDGVLLIGDAAGMAYRESGEGIRPAVETGLMAAEVIKAAVGDYQRERLDVYRVWLTNRFGQRGARQPLECLPLGVTRFILRMLNSTRWLARRVIVDTWFLHRHEKPLDLSARPRISAKG